jgi:pimeloyl-ACP methyl ester carboxylesterase
MMGLTACQTTTPLTWFVPPGASTLEINGYPLAYSARGSEPTVVFVPGVLTDCRIWGSADFPGFPEGLANVGLLSAVRPARDV